MSGIKKQATDMNRAFSARVFVFIILGRCPRLAMRPRLWRYVILGRCPRLWHECRAFGAKHTMALPRSSGEKTHALSQRLIEIFDQIIGVFEADGQAQQTFG